MAISTPTQIQVNSLATVDHYSAKSNLKETSGSFLTQATQLVFDDIQRFQTSPDGYFTDAQLADFKYPAFEGNVIWFMDELVGMESDWIKDAAAKSTTAYGYVQFTEATVETAVNRYKGHLERFNARRKTRNWKPFGVPLNVFVTPGWLIELEASKKTHEEKLDDLTYDQVLALAFVHLHSKKSRDSNFRLLSFGDITAAKEIYTRNHHTSPDTATLARLNDTNGGFFKDHYRPAPVAADIEFLPLAVEKIPFYTWPRLKEIFPVALLIDSVMEEFKKSKHAEHIQSVKERFGW